MRRKHSQRHKKSGRLHAFLDPSLDEGKNCGGISRDCLGAFPTGLKDEFYDVQPKGLSLAEHSETQ